MPPFLLAGDRVGGPLRREDDRDGEENAEETEDERLSDAGDVVEREGDPRFFVGRDVDGRRYSSQGQGEDAAILREPLPPGDADEFESEDRAEDFHADVAAGSSTSAMMTSEAARRERSARVRT